MTNQEIDTPMLLEATNFTPPARTPWGGHRIRALKELGPGPKVGESWELSIEPSFPSRLEDGRRLDGCVGPTSLLVKLLDAAEALSVQIHPRDDDPGLGPDECGKPEAWYIVACDPGAGIYLGLTDSASEETLRAALSSGGDASTLVPFVPVAPGDFFVIEAGTPHCIGPGVFLVEPQRVRPGRRGVTYRYWDWNRRYDEAGAPDPEGRPRALHIDQALAATRWDLPRGHALLERVRVRAGAPDLGGPPRRLRLSTSGPLDVSRLEGTGTLPLSSSLVSGLTVLEGRVRVGGVTVTAGRTAALPAGWAGDAELREAHVIMATT